MASATKRHDADIVILGGGSAGLATAAFLRQRISPNVRILVVERGSISLRKRDLEVCKNGEGLNGLNSHHRMLTEASQTDYGIALSPNATALLALLGMKDSMTELSGRELTKMLLRPETNPEDLPAFEYSSREQFGSPSIFCRRSRLLKWLLARCTEPNENYAEVNFIDDSKITSIDVEKGIAKDDQGNIFGGRLLVGADGIGKIGRIAIRSATKGGSKSCTAVDNELVVHCAYMSIIPHSAILERPSLAFLLDDDLEASTLANWTCIPSSNNAQDSDVDHRQSTVSSPKEQRRIILYPVDAEGNFQLFAYFPANAEVLDRFGREKALDKDGNWRLGGNPASRPGMLRGIDTEEALEVFDDFHQDLKSLLTLNKRIDLCLIRDTDPIPSWTAKNGKAVLIGDAAHATVPHTGQGTAQALEDADALSYYLAKTKEFGRPGKDRLDLQTCLEEFESIRLPRATLVQQTARLSNGTMEGLAELDMVAYSMEIMSWKGAAAAAAHVNNGS